MAETVPYQLDGISLHVEGQVATVTLDRPLMRNAWTIPMFRSFGSALRWCSDEDDVRVVVITGAGDAFSVGADLQANSPSAELEDDDPVAILQEIVTPRDIDKPVIAAINGDAVGIGVTLSLLCDIRVVAEDARMAIPMTRLGIIPELGCHWTLPRIAGLAVASDLLLTGRRFTGAEAESLGVCNRAVARGDVLGIAHDYAREVVERTAPRSVGVVKRLLLDGLEKEFESLRTRESNAYVALTREPDAAEGVASFLEKRLPRWTGSLADPLP